MELLLLSNSTAPGRPFLEHALGEITDVLEHRKHLVFLAQASVDPERYAHVMQEALQPLGVHLITTHDSADPAAEIERAEAVFVGGGNAFRLLKSLDSLDSLELLRDRVRGGMPYLAASAGTNLACPTIRTTNDMPIVEPRTLAALAFVPFQINPHYREPDPDCSHLGENRDQRIAEFLLENDAPVLALREGAWLRVSDRSAYVGGVTAGRIFERGRPALDVPPGTDLSTLLHTIPQYDSPVRWSEDSHTASERSRNPSG